MKSHKRCTLSLNQTLILENWESHSQFQSHFSPQNSHSHSQLSIFPRELSFSFSTLKNFLEKSHSRSRLTVLSHKSVTWHNILKFYLQFGDIIMGLSSHGYKQSGPFLSPSASSVFYLELSCGTFMSRKS